MFYSYFDELCKQRGISQNKACKEMGLARSVASKWKSTQTQPSMNTLMKISEYFNVSIDELLAHSTGAEVIKNPATESDERSEVLNYIIESVKDFSLEDQLQVASVVRSLKQYILTQDNQKESE